MPKVSPGGQGEQVWALLTLLGLVGPRAGLLPRSWTSSAAGAEPPAVAEAAGLVQGTGHHLPAQRREAPLPVGSLLKGLLNLATAA